jgi:hypothetical protein
LLVSDQEEENAMTNADQTATVILPDGTTVEAPMVALDGDEFDASLIAMGFTHWPEVDGYEVHHFGNDQWIAKMPSDPMGDWMGRNE